MNTNCDHANENCSQDDTHKGYNIFRACFVNFLTLFFFGQISQEKERALTGKLKTLAMYRIYCCLGSTRANHARATSRSSLNYGGVSSFSALKAKSLGTRDKAARMQAPGSSLHVQSIASLPFNSQCVDFSSFVP